MYLKPLASILIRSSGKCFLLMGVRRWARGSPLNIDSYSSYGFAGYLKFFNGLY